ncbi:uncharacterized protein LOC114590418 [Podarcis muralis]
MRGGQDDMRMSEARRLAPLRIQEEGAPGAALRMRDPQTGAESSGGARRMRSPYMEKIAANTFVVRPRGRRAIDPREGLAEGGAWPDATVPKLRAWPPAPGATVPKESAWAVAHHAAHRKEGAWSDSTVPKESAWPPSPDATVPKASAWPPSPDATVPKESAWAVAHHAAHRKEGAWSDPTSAWPPSPGATVPKGSAWAAPTRPTVPKECAWTASPDATVPKASAWPPSPDATVPKGSARPHSPDATVPKEGAWAVAHHTAHRKEGAWSDSTSAWLPSPNATVPNASAWPPSPNATVPNASAWPPSPDATVPNASAWPPSPDATLPNASAWLPDSPPPTPCARSASERRATTPKMAPTLPDPVPGVAAPPGAGPHYNSRHIPHGGHAPERVPVTRIDGDATVPLAPLRVLSPRLEGCDVEDAALGPGFEAHGEAALAAAPGAQGNVARYPSAEEIEVIGGYLALERSCMRKGGARRRKKLKISFDDLHTMFEYPSESSLEGQEVEEEEEEAEEEEEEEEEEYASEVDQAPPLPAAKRKEGRSGPGFSTQKTHPGQGGEFEAAPPRTGTVAPGADPPGARVMLTPAGAGARSDFGSEPALYF